MIFTQRLFTLLLGVLFATVLTDQASALYDPGVGRFCSRDPVGYVDGASAYRAYFVGSNIDPTGTEIGVDSISVAMWKCMQKPTIAAQIACLEILGADPRVLALIRTLKSKLPPIPVRPPVPINPPFPIPVPPLPPLGPSPFPPPGPQPVPAPVPNPLPDPSPTPWNSCAVCLRSFPYPLNLIFCLPQCCIEELNKKKGECPKCICKKPSGSNEFYYTFTTKFSCENFPATEKGRSEGVVSCKCGT